MTCENCGKEKEKPKKEKNTGFLKSIHAMVAAHKLNDFPTLSVGNHKFCSEKCRNEWVIKHNIYSFKSVVKSIVDFDVLIVPVELSLADPNAGVEILVNAKIRDIQSSSIDFVCLEFDMEKKEFTHNKLIMQFINGEEMAEKICEAIADNV